MLSVPAGRLATLPRRHLGHAAVAKHDRCTRERLTAGTVDQRAAADDDRAGAIARRGRRARRQGDERGRGQGDDRGGRHARSRDERKHASAFREGSPPASDPRSPWRGRSVKNICASLVTGSQAKDPVLPSRLMQATYTANSTSRDVSPNTLASVLWHQARISVSGTPREMADSTRVSLRT